MLAHISRKLKDKYNSFKVFGLYTLFIFENLRLNDKVKHIKTS